MHWLYIASDGDLITTRSRVGYTPTSVSPNTRKFGRMLDQHKSVLPCKYDGIAQLVGMTKLRMKQDPHVLILPCR